MNDSIPILDGDQARPGPAAAVIDFGVVIGRSRRTVVRSGVRREDGSPVIVVAPRAPPGDSSALALWADAVRRASRLDHPLLPRPIALGSRSGWPFVAYLDTAGESLAGRIGPSLSPRDAAYVLAQTAAGMAFAHEAGVVHGDLQACLVRVSDAGRVEVLGLEIGAEVTPVEGPPHPRGDSPSPDPAEVRRTLMRRDVTSLGMLLHQALADRPALAEPDITEAVLRLPPSGRETVRLPWLPSRVIPQPLRLVADRATDRQESRRYLAARSLVNSLEDWLQAQTLFGTDVLEVLSDRISAAGLLPTTPGSGERAARMAMMESERTQDLAEVVLEDPALAFELLRQVNMAQEHSVLGMGAGPVLTVRRAIAMLGIQGVRRAALSLRTWPGSLDQSAAERLSAQMESCRFAARVAQGIRPRGFDAETVYLVTMLQCLGALAVRYHFPTEAAQIEEVAGERTSEATGEMVGEVSASLAVLGVDFEAVAAFIVKSWGLAPATVRVMRRMPLETHVHTGGSDEEILRATASCALEAVHAMTRDPARRGSALLRVVRRYASALALSERDLRWALGDLGAGSAGAQEREGAL